MIFTLLSHQWKEFWRASDAAKNIAIQILMGFIMLYLLVSAIAVGLMLPKILIQVFPDQDLISVFCGLILYYFAVDIIFRFMLQELPAMAVQPYLVQNISRKQIVSFLNLRSLVSFFNLIPLILFVPFALSRIGAQYGLPVSLAFVLTILSLCVFNHFLILFIKRITIVSSWWLAGFLVVVLVFIAVDYFGIFSIRHFSSVLFNRLLITPWLSIVAVVLAIASFYNNRSYLLRNFYLEEMTKSEGQKSSVDYTWLNRFGEVGDLIALDLKLILRNKRPRSAVLYSGILLFYGFFFFKTKVLDKGVLANAMLGGIFTTGYLFINYGQFLFAWQGNYFDGLMASNIQLKTYIKGKFMLLTAFSTVALLLTLPYGLLSWKIIPIEIAAYFFNIGIHSLVCIYFATRNYKAIDISKTSRFTFKGSGPAQYLYVLLIFFIGMVLYMPVSFLLGAWAAVIAVGTVGLISFLLRDWWIDILSKEMAIRKHRILEGFREK